MRIGRFQWPGVKGFVESQQTVAANFDTTRSDSGPGADKIHNENHSKESCKLAAVSPLVVRVASSTFKPRMEQEEARASTMVKADVLNFSLKDPLLTAQAEPARRDARTG